MKIKYEASVYVTDGYFADRGWRERWLTRPWLPFKMRKFVDEPIVLVIADDQGNLMGLVSYRTYSQLKQAGLEELEWNG